MTPLLYHLGPFCARHSVLILVVWVVVALSVVILAGTVGQERNDDLKLPDTDSQAASDLLSDKFLDQANGSVPIALRAPEGAKLSDSKYKKPIQRVTKAYTKEPVFTQATGPFGDQGGDQLNKKHTIGYISLNLKDSPSELNVEGAQRLIALDRPLDKAGLNPAAGGYLGQKVSKPSTHVSEVVGLSAAVFILLFTFGTAITMGVPILTAILGLFVGLGITTSTRPWSGAFSCPRSWRSSGLRAGGSRSGWSAWPRSSPSKAMHGSPNTKPGLPRSRKRRRRKWCGRKRCKRNRRSRRRKRIPTHPHNGPTRPD